MRLSSAQSLEENCGYVPLSLWDSVIVEVEVDSFVFISFSFFKIEVLKTKPSLKHDGSEVANGNETISQLMRFHYVTLTRREWLCRSET